VGGVDGPTTHLQVGLCVRGQAAVPIRLVVRRTERCEPALVLRVVSHLTQCLRHRHHRLSRQDEIGRCRGRASVGGADGARLDRAPIAAAPKVWHLIGADRGVGSGSLRVGHLSSLSIHVPLQRWPVLFCRAEITVILIQPVRDERICRGPADVIRLTVRNRSRHIHRQIPVALSSHGLVRSN
jgi:hypothetical protein